MKIFYINLANETKRNAHMINQLKNYNYERFEAYNKENYKNYLIVNEHKDNSPATLACLTSHLMLIKQAYEKDLLEIMIMEDDLNLEIFNQTYNILEDIYKTFKKKKNNKKKMDILQIYSASPNAWKFLYKPSLENSSIVLQKKPTCDKLVNIFFGATAYIINRRGMEKIMKWYDIEANRFDLTKYSNFNLSDIFIYQQCRCLITSYPFLNISSNVDFPSTIQTIEHQEIFQNITFKFIEENKEKILTDILNYRNGQIPDKNSNRKDHPRNEDKVSNT